MAWATFQDLLELQLYLEWEDIVMWPPFPVNTWLVLTLLKLALPTSLHYVNHLFWMGKTSVGEVVLESAIYREVNSGAGDLIGPINQDCGLKELDSDLETDAGYCLNALGTKDLVVIDVL
ncbi:hypothetical protein Y1Q_0022274 [Alligator mississippiensis]|uniref:Uncharacterized protein n=1 Tax=Alligator mississippiensis TaxID=8496 RepID=A0A151P074_ALLMI|nr:hypothetical protein Y1Q_0022274 [Alligator mississippiensis]